ncbi:helix-turn-helix domain-containing protein [Nocardia terpenica]|uniref:hypothetical protein n=1 Tax=Nocardia terpenica TaxID=455432 RepID=UPI002FE36DFF
MENYRSIRHPLASLRQKSGLSHGGYAQLVARAHAELGFGSMAARREKIARWESGKVTPEISAQLAMAHLHGVSDAEVHRLGWPDWLYVATGHSALLTAPWTHAETIQALDNIARATHGTGAHGYTLLASQQGILDLTSAWLHAAAEPLPLPLRGGMRIDGLLVDVLERRLGDLRTLFVALGAYPVRPLAAAELRMIGHLVRNASYDQSTAVRLLATAASVACFSGWLAYELGDHAGAQSAFLIAMRVAAAAREPQLGAWAMTLIAKQYVDLGKLASVHLLLDGAERLCAPSHPSRRMSAVFAVTHALASAKQGETDDFERHVGAARTAHTAEMRDDDPDFTDWLTTESMASQIGNSYVYLGKMDKALDHLLPLGSGLPARDTALQDAHMAIAHAASGDVDVAVDLARKVAAFLAHSPSHGVETYHHMLLSELSKHSHARVVRDFLDEQAD